MSPRARHETPVPTFDTDEERDFYRKHGTFAPAVYPSETIVELGERIVALSNESRAMSIDPELARAEIDYLTAIRNERINRAVSTE